MNSQLKEVERLVRKLKLQIPFSPDCDPAHDLIDRIIELCNQSAQDRALDFLRARYMEVESAAVTAYEVDGKWLRVGIPRRQPLDQQIDWCINKKAAFLEITMTMNGSAIQSEITETFNITHFKK